jgi:hypothetical protein
VALSFALLTSSSPNYMSEIPDMQIVNLAGSLLLAEFAAQRDEILRHNWLESEKARQDIGFEKAFMGWVLRHRSAWLEERRRRMN